jgi:hypothetical protein
MGDTYEGAEDLRVRVVLGAARADERRFASAPAGFSHRDLWHLETTAVR